MEGEGSNEEYLVPELELLFLLHLTFPWCMSVFSIPNQQSVMMKWINPTQHFIIIPLVFAVDMQTYYLETCQRIQTDVCLNTGSLGFQVIYFLCSKEHIHFSFLFYRTFHCLNFAQLLHSPDMYYGILAGIFQYFREFSFSTYKHLSLVIPPPQPRGTQHYSKSLLIKFPLV